MITEAVPGAGVIALRTPTLPPATHTNTWVLGRRRRVVVDPASPYPEEQDALLSALDALEGEVDRILLTHHHHDHVGGAVALKEALAARGRAVPVVAHPVTRHLLDGEVAIDETLDEGDVLHTDDGLDWDVVFTPGHAPGHIVLHARQTGAVVAGDLVAGIGTILIDPQDGDLGLYLDSLQRVLDRQPGALLPSHGPVLEAGEAVLEYYLAHRHQRSASILAALQEQGPSDPASLVAAVYPDLDPRAHPIAALQLTSHLRWLAGQGSVERLDGDRWQAVSG